MKKPVFVNGYFYHIYNRGVEKRDIFIDDRDYLRFIHNIYEFNNEDPVTNLNFYLNSTYRTMRKTHIKLNAETRKELVEVLIFTLMPNHYHLLVRQKRDKGIVKFMQKLGTGYTNYFNKKYARVGALFQGRFKATLVEKEAHLIHLPHYLHTNPLDLNYRSSTSIEFLEEYQWSSFPDYVGKRNFPHVTERDFILNIFGGHEKYREYTIEKLKLADRESIFNELKDVIIEVELR